MKRGYKTKEEAYARQTSSTTTTGWEGYAKASNNVKYMVEKKKEEGLWEDAVNKPNQDFEGGMKQMWSGMKGILGKQAGEADTGIIATSRAQNGKIVSSSSGEREVLVVH